MTRRASGSDGTMSSRELGALGVPPLSFLTDKIVTPRRENPHYADPRPGAGLPTMGPAQQVYEQPPPDPQKSWEDRFLEFAADLYRKDLSKSGTST